MWKEVLVAPVKPPLLASRLLAPVTSMLRSSKVARPPALVVACRYAGERARAVEGHGHRSAGGGNTVAELVLKLDHDRRRDGRACRGVGRLLDKRHLVRRRRR